MKAKRIFLSILLVLCMAMTAIPFTEVSASEKDGEAPKETVIAETKDDVETEGSLENVDTEALEESSEVQEEETSLETTETLAEEITVSSDMITFYDRGPGGSSGSKEGTADHIDIGVTVKASLTIGDETMQQNLTLEQNDFNSSNVTITATKGGSPFTGFSSNFTRITTSTGESGIRQYRISGSYPTGTKENPVSYTVSLKKTVTFTSKSGQTYGIPMTFTATFDYWDANNDCPGIGSRETDGTPKSFNSQAGLDFVLGSSAKNIGMLTITKRVKDEEGSFINANGKKYSFDIYTSDGTKVDSVTVETGEDGIGIGSTDLDYGTYYIVETSKDDIDNYTYDCTVIGEKTGLTSDTVTISSATSSVGITVDNIYKEDVTEVSVKKNWNDKGNQDGKRPNSIDVQLYANGEKYGNAVTLNSSNDWAYTWKNLPVKNQGTAIKYTVKEVSELPEGYESEVTGDAVKGYTITNSYTPEETSVSVRKEWDDQGDQDGNRPKSITVRLLADGEPKDSVVLKEENQWSYTFTGLPKYRDGGVAIVYTLTEDAVANYATDIKDGIITNSYTPKKTSVTVTKSWDDKNDQDGKRLKSITVQLYADGEVCGEAVTLSASNDWTYTWTGLSMYKNHGTAIKYTVEEVSELPEGYESEVTGDAVKGYTITNSYTPEETSVSVRKEWDDQDDQDGNRPKSITVRLLADGIPKDSVVLKEENQWSYTFTGLPKYRDGGVEIVYTLTEDAVANYATEIKEGIITNSYTPKKTSVTVTKSWDDKNDQDGKRPKSITVQLYADGETCGEAVILAASNDWTYTWTELSMYKDHGTAIKYTVEEVSELPEGYESEVTGDAVKGYTITNSYTPETCEEKEEPKEPTVPKDNNSGDDGKGKTAAPHTGDHANVGLYLILMFAALVGIVSVIVVRKRRFRL